MIDLIKRLAKESGKPVVEVRQMWRQARQATEKAGFNQKSSTFLARAMHALKEAVKKDTVKK